MEIVRNGDGEEPVVKFRALSDGALNAYEEHRLVLASEDMASSITDALIAQRRAGRRGWLTGLENDGSMAAKVAQSAIRRSTGGELEKAIAAYVDSTIASIERGETSDVFKGGAAASDAAIENGLHLLDSYLAFLGCHVILYAQLRSALFRLNAASEGNVVRENAVRVYGMEGEHAPWLDQECQLHEMDDDGSSFFSYGFHTEETVRKALVLYWEHVVGCSEDELAERVEELNEDGMTLKYTFMYEPRDGEDEEAPFVYASAREADSAITMVFI